MPSPLTRSGYRTTRNFDKVFSTNADGRPRPGCVGILNTMRTYVKTHFVLSKKGGKYRTPKRKMGCRLVSAPIIRLTEGLEVRRVRMESLLIDLLKARLVGVFISSDENILKEGIDSIQSPEQRAEYKNRLRQAEKMILGYREGQILGVRKWAGENLNRIKAEIRLAKQWLEISK